MPSKNQTENVNLTAAKHAQYSFEDRYEKRFRSEADAGEDFNALKKNLGIPASDTKNDALLRELVIHVHLNIKWYQTKIASETRRQRGFFFGTLAVIVLVPIATYLIATQGRGNIAALTPVVTGFLAFQNAMRSYFEKRNYVSIFHRAASALKKELYRFEQKWTGEVPTVSRAAARDVFTNAICDVIRNARSIEDEEEDAYFNAKSTIPSVDMGALLTGSTQAATSAVTQQVTAITSTSVAQQQALAMRAQVDAHRERINSLNTQLASTTDPVERQALQASISSVQKDLSSAQQATLSIAARSVGQPR